MLSVKLGAKRLGLSHLPRHGPHHAPCCHHSLPSPLRPTAHRWKVQEEGPAERSWAPWGVPCRALSGPPWGHRPTGTCLARKDSERRRLNAIMLHGGNWMNHLQRGEIPQTEVGSLERW